MGVFEMPTRAATTAHGEVEYETVECSSCGNEIPKDEASRFIIGDCAGVDKWSHRGDEWEFTSYRTGWACPYCRDDPAGYPTARIGGWFADLDPFVQVMIIMFVGVALLVVVGNIMAVFT